MFTLEMDVFVSFPTGFASLYVSSSARVQLSTRPQRVVCFVSVPIHGSIDKATYIVSLCC